MKKINIIEFLKKYLLTLIIIGAAFLCSNNTNIEGRKNIQTEKESIAIKTGTDINPNYYLSEERSWNFD
ncbi:MULTISPECIES: hypothetical protein [unclassified Clostridium]|uniref:hypothetical protein n=1 Tax=unclassified Clostridium TaxID=2614128 RepID=UPI00030DB4AB|nr:MULTISPECIES: hypothetical protein [unclassified Clostridium]